MLWIAIRECMYNWYKLVSSSHFTWLSATLNWNKTVRSAHHSITVPPTTTIQISCVCDSALESNWAKVQIERIIKSNFIPTIRMIWVQTKWKIKRNFFSQFIANANRKEKKLPNFCFLSLANVNDTIWCVRCAFYKQLCLNVSADVTIAKYSNCFRKW